MDSPGYNKLKMVALAELDGLQESTLEELASKFFKTSGIARLEHALLHGQAEGKWLTILLYGTERKVYNDEADNGELSQFFRMRQNLQVAVSSYLAAAREDYTIIGDVRNLPMAQDLFMVGIYQQGKSEKKSGD